MLAGLLIFCFNETQVASLMALEQLARETSAVASCDSVDPGNNDRLVYVQCGLQGMELFREMDGLGQLPTSDVTGLRLTAKVDVYQWIEVGEGGPPDKEYKRGWRDYYVDTTTFLNQAKLREACDTVGSALNALGPQSWS
jgi:hypothetical protein